MSNGNSLQKHPAITLTATVAILNSSKTSTFLVYNETLRAIVSPGGKWEPTDINIYNTGLREVREETKEDLLHTSGNWLDINGEVITSQKIVQTFPFQIRERRFIDHLFLFRLLDEDYTAYGAGSGGQWYSKKSLQAESCIFYGLACRILVPGTREAILRVMKGPI